MNNLIPYIWIAGGVQLAIASANVILPRKLRYGANLAKVDPHYCPAKSRIESAGWGHRVSFRGGRTAARPVKWAFSRKG